MSLLKYEELPDYLTPQQVATYLGISRRRVYEYCQMTKEVGGLESFTIGASRKIDKQDLTRWIQDRRKNA